MERIPLDRAKRVQRIKKAIIGIIICFVLLPTILCVVLLFRIIGMQKELIRLQEENVSSIGQLIESQESLSKLFQDRLDEQQKEITRLSETVDDLRSEDQIPDTNSVADDIRPKKVYLTFDDGPSGHTQDILDILDEYGVKGNFFVCATPNEKYLKYYKQILDEGHMLGLHSYTHEYDEIYASEEAFEKDVKAIRDFVKEQTGGFDAKFYRFPGGSSNLHSRISLSACADWLEEQGLIYYDWNLSSQDATNPMQSVDNIIRNATYGCENFDEAVILMHDLGNKDTTVEALPKIIEYYQGLGAQISVIDENSMRVQHDK